MYCRWTVFLLYFYVLYCTVHCIFTLYFYTVFLLYFYFIFTVFLLYFYCTFTVHVLYFYCIFVVLVLYICTVNLLYFNCVFTVHVLIQYIKDIIFLGVPPYFINILFHWYNKLFNRLNKKSSLTQWRIRGRILSKIVKACFKMKKKSF